MIKVYIKLKTKSHICINYNLLKSTFLGAFLLDVYD